MGYLDGIMKAARLWCKIRPQISSTLTTGFGDAWSIARRFSAIALKKTNRQIQDIFGPAQSFRSILQQ